MTLWFQRPAIILSMAVLALIGFIVLPVAATLRHNSELESSLFSDATVSDTPSNFPSDVPSAFPSSVPSDTPSDIPSVAPSVAPSVIPSVAPSVLPSVAPSVLPSVAPSTAPTDFFSILPTSPILTRSDVPSLLPRSEPETTGPTRLEEMTDVRRKLRRQRRHRTIRHAV
jgi:hypothetical protein